MFRTYYLQVSESVSRQRDTEGQQVLTLTDIQTRKACTVTGGGFDRLGTAFGEWLQTTFQQRLTRLAHLAEVSIVDGVRCTGAILPGYVGQELIGFTFTASKKAGIQSYGAHIDGGVGFQSMLSIALALGLHVESVSNDSRDTVMLIVTDQRYPKLGS